MTWQLRRVGDLATLLNGFPFDANDFLEVGEVPLIRIRDLLNRTPTTFVNASIVPPSAYLCDGDVVIGMDGDFNVILWDRGPAALNQRLCILRSHPETDPRFLAYVLPDHLRVINDLTYATTVKHLSSGQVRAIRFQCPPLEMQRTIADFLDAETHKIDQLISEQERLIELLNERRRTVLDEVTSDVIGELVRLKYLFAPSSVCTFPDEEVLSVYRDFGVIPKGSRNDNFNRTPENVDRYLLVQPGDLVVNKMKAWQGSLGISSHRGIVSGDYEVARPISDRLLPEFSHAFLRSPKMIAEYAKRSTGVRPSQWRLYWGQLGSIEVPVPTIADQQRLLDRLGSQVGMVNQTVEETRRFIDLVRERRSAIITAAVTGQIDVWEFAA